MIRASIWWLLSFCIFSQAHAESLSFVAQVEDENLAEEAILLAHCLSERSGLGWEFSGEAKGTHWLKISEQKKRLSATYRNGKKETTLLVDAGGSDEACEKLEPAQQAAPPLLSSLSPKPEEKAMHLNGDDELDSPKSKTWLWVGGAGAVALAGFFIWKSHQPDHRSIVMAP